MTTTISLAGDSLYNTIITDPINTIMTGGVFYTNTELDVFGTSEDNTFLGYYATIVVETDALSLNDTLGNQNLGVDYADVYGISQLATVNYGQLIGESGGTVIGAEIGNGGGTVSIEAGSSAYLMKDAGLVYVYGTDNGDAVVGGGYQAVEAGGISNNTTISNENPIFEQRGGVQDIYGIANNDTIETGGEVDVISTLNGALINGGTIYALADSTIEGTLTFGGLGGILHDATTGNLIIAGFATAAPGTDIIDLSGTSFPSELVTLGSSGILTLGSIKETFVNGAGMVLNIAPTSSGVQITEVTAPCFAAGTRILTPRGEVAVENLAVGESVIVASGEDAPITWIGKRQLNLSRHPQPEKAQPIRFATDCFSDGVPSHDLILSPDHALHIDGALVPAKALINGKNICQLNQQSVTYYHIELAEHSIIFAEGTGVESYLETGNRGAFENGVGARTLHPDFAQTMREGESCAPFVESGHVVENARMRTLQRHYATNERQKQNYA
jgi:hypothetical protein